MLAARRAPPGADIALWRRSRHKRVSRNNVADRTQGATCCPLGPRLALRRSVGGESPQPSRADVSIATQLRASRTVLLIKTQGASSRPGRGPAAAGGYRVCVSIATQLRATRRWFWLGQERVVPPRHEGLPPTGRAASRRCHHLPVGEIADGCSAQQKRGQRGSGFFLGRERVLPSARRA